MPNTLKLVALAVVSAALLAGCADEPAGDGPDTRDAITVDGHPRFPNTSTTDWVTYGDHVVVASVVSEEEYAWDDDAAVEEAGSIDRMVGLQVEELLWSAEEPQQEAPTDSFEMIAFGWAVQDGERIPMRQANAPRLEVGHTYIVTLRWLPERSDEPDPDPARWDTLGPESIVPYDNGSIGDGEGAEEAPAAARSSTTTGDPTSVEDRLAGQGADDLAAVLKTTDPGVEENFE